MKARARLCCALLGFHRSQWNASADRPCVQMGEDPDIAGDNIPYESFDDGCPGAWYRCGFAASLLRYQRAMFENGVGENVLLSRSHDSLVHAAIRRLEAEGMRLRSHAHDLRSDT